jgi:GNAT superfamily N-acetyltransferase
VAGSVSFEPLAEHRELLPILQQWFEAEWPSYYCADGPGDAQRDLIAFANRGSLPVGILAFRNGSVCGIAALKAESIATHKHLSPWAAAGFVVLSERGQRVGTGLIAALEQEARTLGFRHIYCATSTAESLLRSSGWQFLERIVHDNEPLGIYRKAL